MMYDVRCTFTTTGKCGKCSSRISTLTVHLMDLSCQTRFVENFALFRWRPCGALSFPSGSQSGPPCASEGVAICDTLLTVLFMFVFFHFFHALHHSLWIFSYKLQVKHHALLPICLFMFIFHFYLLEFAHHVFLVLRSLS